MTKPKSEPTPEEIRAMCEEIRKGWDPRRLAAQERRRSWSLPHLEDPNTRARKGGSQPVG